jgi:hypothetical protein
MARLLVRASSQHISRTFSGPVSGYHWTVAAWVYLNSLPAQQWLVMAGPPSTYWGIPILSTGAFRAQIDGNAGGATLIEAGTLTTGAWFHVAAAFASNTLAIYQNGTQVTTGGNVEAFPITTAYSVGRNTSGSDYFDGRIAEHAVWSRHLNDSEILALAKGVCPLAISPALVELYWPLWGQDSTEVDLSGNTYNGAVTGATAANHSPAGYPLPLLG